MTTLKRLLRRRQQQVLQWLTGYQEICLGRLPDHLRRCHRQTCRVCNGGAQTAAGRRLVYLAPASRLPGGGGKVIYRHVELAQAAGLPVDVLHPERAAGFRYPLFEHAVRPIADPLLCPARDHLVLPEVWAALGQAFCTPHGFAYSIFVQNGYLLQHTAGFSVQEVHAGYAGAQTILSISADVSAMVARIHPAIPASRIQRVQASIPRRFRPAPTKRREITFMPRKLTQHADRMQALLTPLLPEGWTMVRIEHADEAEVARRLAHSAIFLSFSELEGLGLPPLEAALAGNRVIGYHGQGGKEFFHPPIFRAVACGDLGDMIDQTLAAIAEFEDNPHGSDAMLHQRAWLEEAYGAERERASVLQFQRQIVASAPGPGARPL